MEVDMACPRCHSPMIFNGDMMVCIGCPYQYRVAKRAPTITELLEANEKLQQENERLKKKNRELKVAIASVKGRLEREANED